MKGHNPNTCPNCKPELFYVPVVYNYKCPVCHGKFNQPAYHVAQSTTVNMTGVTYHCPFCNLEMKGF